MSALNGANTPTTKSVTTRHKEFLAMSGKWERCRAAAAGRDALHANALSYLPKLCEQSDSDYASYLLRAVFYNATWRTIAGLTGMLFRKPPGIDAADPLMPLFDDITLANMPLTVFAQQLARECFTFGRAGVLVDYPTVPEAGGLTRARAAALNLRPVLQLYRAENIINWRTRAIGNVTKVVLVVLTEEAYLPTDEFSGRTEARYRVLDLAADPNAPDQLAYRVRVFRINEKTDSQEQVGADLFPLMNDKPLADIPFQFFGVETITPTVETPPLVDLVDLNLAHFRVSADFEHGCHFSALPTAVVSGYQPMNDNDKLYLGSTTAWVFPDPSAHAGFLEFNGAGLGMLMQNLAHKEQQMAALGARLLTADAGPQETATTAAIHHGGETAVLSAVAQVLSLGLSRVLTLFSRWAGIEQDVSYTIHREFFPLPMDAGTLAGIVAAWQGGAISAETLFENLQRGEIIAAERSFDDEQDRIKANPYTPPALPAAQAATPTTKEPA